LADGVDQQIPSLTRARRRHRRQCRERSPTITRAARLPGTASAAVV